MHAAVGQVYSFDPRVNSGHLKSVQTTLAPRRRLTTALLSDLDTTTKCGAACLHRLMAYSAGDKSVALNDVMEDDVGCSQMGVSELKAPEHYEDGIFLSITMVRPSQIKGQRSSKSIDWGKRPVWVASN